MWHKLATVKARKEALLKMLTLVKLNGTQGDVGNSSGLSLEKCFNALSVWGTHTRWVFRGLVCASVNTCTVWPQGPRTLPRGEHDQTTLVIFHVSEIFSPCPPLIPGCFDKLQVLSLMQLKIKKKKFNIDRFRHDNKLKDGDFIALCHPDNLCKLLLVEGAQRGCSNSQL